MGTQPQPLLTGLALERCNRFYFTFVSVRLAVHLRCDLPLCSFTAQWFCHHRLGRQYRYPNHLNCPTSQRPVSFLVCAGTWPPTPPPRVAAALDGGLLPCLERLTRRAARDPEGRISKLVQDVLCSPQTARGVAKWPALLWPLAYGEAGQSMGFMSALASLLPQRARGGGGGGNMSRRGPKGGPNEGDPDFLSLRVTSAAIGFLSSGFELRTPSYSPEGGGGGRGGSEGTGGSAACATWPPGVPPPGPCRLHHVNAHAARLLLPPLAHFVCCHCGGADRVPPGRDTPKTMARDYATVALDPLLKWIMGVALMRLDGSCGGLSRGGGGSRDSEDADCSAGSSSSGSTGARATHIRGHALGDGGDGRALAAGQEQQQQQQQQLQRRREEEKQQQQQQEQEVTSALHDVPSIALRRFLFEEVQAVELLGTVLLHLPSLNTFTAWRRALVRALCLLTAAYPEEVRRRVAAAAEGCQGGGSRSGSGCTRGGGGAKKQRGVSGAGAGCSSQPGSLWPVELIRGLGPLLREDADKNEVDDLVAAMESLAGLLEGWRRRGVGKGEGEERGVAAEGEGRGAAGGLEVLWPALKRMDGREDAGEALAGMGRVLQEVLGAIAAPPVGLITGW